MRSEMEIMKGLKHENVVELLDAKVVRDLCFPLEKAMLTKFSQGTDNYIYMVLEYCAGRSFRYFCQ